MGGSSEPRRTSFLGASEVHAHAGEEFVGIIFRIEPEIPTVESSIGVGVVPGLELRIGRLHVAVAGGQGHRLPDGDRTADHDVPDEDTLFVVDRDGSNLTELLVHLQGVQDPAWSPTGEVIAFSLSGLQFEAVSIEY